MVFYQHDGFGIYFGDANDQLYPEQYKRWCEIELKAHPPIAHVMHEFALKRLLFLRQIHSTKGVLVTPFNNRTIPPFCIDGDFLITNMSRIGLGVVTADCLPVICMDNRHHVVGIAHAGWRGAVAGVIPQMLDVMCKQLAVSVTDMQVYLGPSAQSCCYEVDASFEVHMTPYPYASDVLELRGGKWYFDLPGLVCHQLASYGMNRSQISQSYTCCTICNPRFFSHRRAIYSDRGKYEGRQMSVVALKNNDV